MATRTQHEIAAVAAIIHDLQLGADEVERINTAGWAAYVCNDPVALARSLRSGYGDGTRCTSTPAIL